MDYNKLLNPLVTGIKPSGIRKFFDIAETMSDIISLGVGEPDFHTPWHIREVGIQSLQAGKTRYTSNAGLISLRREVARYMKNRYSLAYSPDNQILVSVGGSEAIDGCLRTLVQPGDEVLIPEPSFVCYDPLTRLCGGTPVIIPTKMENSFRITKEELQAAITPKTKLLILPYPNNPTGGVMRREHLEDLADVLRGTDIMVLSDEIYAELTYGEESHVSIASLPGMYDRTVVVNGFSKTFSMTGWRLGYACGPEPILGQMIKIHQFAIMSSPTTSQYAAIEALANGQPDVDKMIKEYDARRRLILNGFRQIGLDCFTPEGAFYVFPSIKSTGLSSDEFCERLIYEQKVALVPGTAFGQSGEGYVRASYCYSVKHIKEALSRVKIFLDSLK